ncbi:hypothetical protein Hypma_011108 [Hypsizygus marmoreus]|uniref:Uncharacterized protein n=1 Tax=Hypsizygus marmoreus TaxID=39966 RepID=A0A369JNX5_HYPMA|nr:hypothetical protein Hypma_011108 [Hypsizygus marmoreus]
MCCDVPAEERREGPKLPVKVQEFTYGERRGENRDQRFPGCEYPDTRSLWRGRKRHKAKRRVLGARERGRAG